jgi:small GTP-binding protein
MYVRRLGYYLIELNSGRLKGGSQRYRSTMSRMESTSNASAAAAAANESKDEPVTVTIAVIGQVKAGKSSLINCLIGKQAAAVDTLPMTPSVKTYELQMEGHSDRLRLLDTPGYSDSGATAAQIRETRAAVRNADLVLLVMDARSSAKQSDSSTLDDLAAFFNEEHRLKPPPIIGVVSKIDGLSPLMEWSPPYHWESPSSGKEKSIRAATDFVQETFGQRLAAIVPVCTDLERGHVFGVEEYLMPALSLLLDEARACSLVRSLHRDYDKQKGWQVVSQLMAAGSKIKEAAPAFLHQQLTENVSALRRSLFPSR